MGNLVSSHKRRTISNGKFSYENSTTSDEAHFKQTNSNNDENAGLPKPCTGVIERGKQPESEGSPSGIDCTSIYYVYEPTPGNEKEKETITAIELENGAVAISHEEDDVDNTVPIISADNGEGLYDSLDPFQRFCNGRSSQQTTSSSADSAYTDSTNNTNGCQTCSNAYFCYNCLPCRAQNMEYMTDVYKRTLQRDLRVRDILPDLHFLDELKREEILKKAKESRQDAVEMLLESVKYAEDEGKWQTFIEALENSDYKFIVKLLKGETENDQEKNKTLLSLLSRELINNIDVEECLDLLFEKYLLNERDKEDIEAEQKMYGPIAAAYKMFNIVPARSPEWDKELPVILDQCGLSHIAKLLKFSSESASETKPDQTQQKEGICCHGASQRHHYTRSDSRSHRHEIYLHMPHSKTQEEHTSTGVGKGIKGISKRVQDIESEGQKQLSTITILEKNHSSDLHEIKATLKQTTNEIKTNTQKFSEQTCSLKEIKSDLKRQELHLIAFQEQHQNHFDDLKSSLAEIRISISTLTDLITPIACNTSVHIASDSGFSGRSESNSGRMSRRLWFETLDDTEDELRCKL